MIDRGTMEEALSLTLPIRKMERKGHFSFSEALLIHFFKAENPINICCVRDYNRHPDQSDNQHCF